MINEIIKKINEEISQEETERIEITNSRDRDIWNNGFDKGEKRAFEKAKKIILEEQKDMHNNIATTIEQWDEDDGNCLWWKFPIEEPPYCGTPLDSEWEEQDYSEYYTHFTRLTIPIIEK